jgi:hypothetical protein
MKLIRAVLVGLAASAGTGCFTARSSGPDWFYHHAARNLTEKPIANLDEHKFLHAVRAAADAAWDEVCRADGNAHSRPYAAGFREGFVDYVEAGGTGEPPYLPPFRYRLTKYRSVDGIAAAEDWYAGFRHGAAVARGSGLRELNYVPLPGPAIPASAVERAPANLPAPGPLVNPPDRPEGRPDGLPPPRPVLPPSMPPPVLPVPPVPGPAVGKVLPARPVPPPAGPVVKEVTTEPPKLIAPAGGSVRGFGSWTTPEPQTPPVTRDP